MSPSADASASWRFSPQSDNRSSTLPEILRISNVDEEGNILPVESETVQFLGLTWLWHTDSSFRPIPCMGAILHGVEVTEEGGETLFANL